jgi:hypothetical protein
MDIDAIFDEMMAACRIDRSDPDGDRFFKMCIVRGAWSALVTAAYCLDTGDDLYAWIIGTLRDLPRERWLVDEGCLVNRAYDEFTESWPAEKKQDPRRMDIHKSFIQTGVNRALRAVIFRLYDRESLPRWIAETVNELAAYDKRLFRP